MRRGVWLLVLGVFAAALGAASAYAAGTTTTATTTTTSTTTTTTGTTTTTPPPPTYSPLPASYLPRGCVGAGSAAIAVPGRRVLMLGTPATSRGPSAYPTKSPVVQFLSSTAYGSGCTTARVGLASVSLFGGSVTASSITATHGRGGVSGFAIDGKSAALGGTVRIGGWGEATAGKTVGRITAPLVVRLLAAHGGLPAGTTIALAFGASAQAVHKSKPNTKRHHAGGSTQHNRSKSPPKQVGHARKHHKPKVNQPLTAVPGLGFKPSHYVFPIDGGASYIDTYGANRNDIYDGWHHGDDLFAPLGTPVVAVARGTLSLVGWNELGGWRVWLTDKKGNSFYYAHLAGYARWILTHPHVRRGQVIGFLGRTGDAFTTAPHVHFEVHPHQPAFVKLGYDGAVDPTTYLHKWKIEHVPVDEIPRPARLKAPVGAPRQEAAVVWHQLLVARHLLGIKTPKEHSRSGSKPAEQHAFVRPLHFAAAGAMPLPIAHVRPTAAHVSASESNMPLLVGGPLGGVLAVSAAAGAFAFRRRRRPAEIPAPDASS
jgi:murein DD-endopeptidase MepM/ murein hydrolase activator NlpD